MIHLLIAKCLLLKVNLLCGCIDCVITFNKNNTITTELARKTIEDLENWDQQCQTLNAVKLPYPVYGNLKLCQKEVMKFFLTKILLVVTQKKVLLVAPQIKKKKKKKTKRIKNKQKKK